MPEKYLAKHTKWRGEFVLNDDGTFTGGQGKRGNGIWEKDGDELILKWYHWGTQRLEKTEKGYKSDMLKLIHKQSFVSISFCTTCKGRLEHLKETLPENLETASKYENMEFVLLDYNSQDGLEEWVRSEMMDYIKSGRLVYYKNSAPKYFDMSHAKNMVHRLGSNDILCNLDADNKLSDEFIKQLRFEFANHSGSVLKPNSNMKGNAGRISISRENFFRLRGYDETAYGWGNEDQDFFNKCDIWGLKPIRVMDAYSIPHSDKERAQNYPTKKIRQSSQTNAKVLKQRMMEGYFISNIHDSFGEGKVTKNFEEDIVLEELEVLTEKATHVRTYMFSSKYSNEPETRIRFFEGPNVFLKEIRGSTIKGISSYWFEKGTWEEKESTIHMRWKNRELELFNRDDDGSFFSENNTLVKTSV
jgi:hypothetical protein